MVRKLVGIEKRKEESEKETRDTRSLLRVREDAAYAIGSGTHSAPQGGAVNIERIGLTADYRYTATFAHNPNLTKSSSGIGIVWVSIPKVDESLDHHEEAMQNLRKLRRGLEEET
jgi:hypothetical protein